MKPTRLIGAFVVVLMSCAAPTRSYPALDLCTPNQRNTDTKTCIVDGDTLWLSGIKYRLKGFDTPETRTNICGGASEKALGVRATLRLQNLLNTNPWTIEAFGPDRTGTRTEATIRIRGTDVGIY